jgi:2-polyprenyl-3-methyl-5-hydroxy-6-metoxy-1,4-benzoquinol methylase
MYEYVCCDLCGSSNHKILYSKIDYVTNWEFHVVRCDCGMVFVNPMPLQEHLNLLYPHHYLDEKPLLDDLYKRMLNTVPSHVSAHRLLDIGCGSGDFIRYANSKGWVAEGVDFANWIEKEQDIKITVGEFPLMDIRDSSFDVITAWAVMEHVRKPSQYFEKIGMLLRPNGKFIFTVPNVASPGMSYSCDEDTPRHLWLFTPNAIKEYLEKYGMKLERSIHDGSIYRAYPFGLVRRGYHSLLGRKDLSCKMYQNKSIALLKNKPIDIYFRRWINDVFGQLSLLDIGIDAIDFGLGLLVGSLAKMLRNYGVITVVASKPMMHNSRPDPL